MPGRRELKLDRRTQAMGVVALSAALGTAVVELARVWRRGSAELPTETEDVNELLEAAEQGDHLIVVSDQPGCTVMSAVANRKTYLPVNGTVTVPVSVKNHASGDATYFVDVTCA